MTLFHRPRHAAGLAIVMSLIATAAAQGQGRVDEYQLKAAFLFNLAKFVQWPSSGPSDPLVIGVLGSDSFTHVLDGLVRGKKLQGREVVARRFAKDDDPQAYHIVFVSGAEPRHTADLLRRVGTASVLTVGETPDFLREGGLVRFYVEDNRVRFQINAQAADQAGLRISSQLLSLARQ